MTPKPFNWAIRKRLWVGILMVLALVFLLSAMRYLRADADTNLPRLGLMTTLPLQWSEGGIEAAISPDAEPHPVYSRLAARYDLVPLDNLDSIGGLNLIVLAQPRAMAPAELVKLDAWVRRGGRLLILADPALQWGSLYPIGDKRRPLFTSMLSPLFSHWGIELVLPIGDDQPVAVREIEGLKIRTRTPGEWQSLPANDGANCKIKANALYADCLVGKGRAILIADVDLLDTPNWEGQGVRAISGSDEFGNVLWIEALLTDLRDNVGKRVSNLQTFASTSSI